MKGGGIERSRICFGSDRICFFFYCAFKNYDGASVKAEKKIKNFFFTVFPKTAEKKNSPPFFQKQQKKFF